MKSPDIRAFLFWTAAGYKRQAGRQQNAPVKHDSILKPLRRMQSQQVSFLPPDAICLSEWSIEMGSINDSEAKEAVSSMKALQSALTEELEDIESRIDALAEDDLPLSASEAAEELKICGVARAALFGALASINEVLGWVHLMAERDSNGNVAEVISALPIVPVFSIH